MKTDIEIAQATKGKRIDEVAKSLGIDLNHLIPYGTNKAKIELSEIKESKAKLVLVTAINPTKAGEGKSTTTIGLADALSKLNQNVVVALREPSLGPVFGLKGGATGGGYAQVIPMEDLNLHFTGDLHAMTAANNLISAIIDNHIFQGNDLKIKKVTWKRAMDMNDRSLRQIEIGKGKGNGQEREDGFVITVASEIMAVLCLSTSIETLKEKLAKIVIGYNENDELVTVGDLGIVGALALLLKDAIKPNLVQTLEGTPAIVHGGPFANIAHGCNSLIATQMAMGLGDIVVTEAGFGADLGAEKFFNIKCREGQLTPDAVVIVATIRALKYHGGIKYEDLETEDVDALMAGVSNLEKHIENIKSFGLPYVIAINQFGSDTINEIDTLLNWCRKKKHPVSLSTVYSNGGKGGIDLAKHVLKLIELEKEFKFTYQTEDSLQTKIEKISKKIYGAYEVEYSQQALDKIEDFTNKGYGDYLVCMAKTPNSLSDQPVLLGRPKNFIIHVEDVQLSAGAGFIVVLTGKVMTMPGLPKHPAALNMDILDDGEIVGLF